MKFLDDCDAKLFLIEIDRNHPKIDEADSNYVPTDEEVKSFIKSRKKYSSIIKDAQKSSKQKENWRRNRTKMMSGIKAFHRSTQGKRFHKRLGRFLATRITDPGRTNTTEALKGVASLRTSMYSELEYYHTMTEQVALEDMILEYGISILNSVENKIIKDEDLDETELDFLICVTENIELLRSLSDKSGKTLDTVERNWKEIISALKKDGHEESDEDFYGLVVSILKKKLNLT